MIMSDMKLNMQQISSSVWPSFFDVHGKTLDEYSIRKWTFYKGMSPDVRANSWKFIVGYCSFSSTKTERERLDREMREEYEKLSQQLEDMVHSGSCSSELSQYMRVIEKDSVRTDRHMDYFDEDKNIKELKRILGTFALHDPQLGYVQGMNELLSPLMIVLQNEHQSFWCLANVLNRMRSNFTDLSLSQPLCELARLCLYADTQLHTHIDTLYEGEDWLFCYRGLLLNFKREFAFEDVLSLWETIWCNHSTTRYELFVGVAILVQYKTQLMQCSTVESLMEFSMGICGRVPLEPVQEIARSLVEQLKADEYCPYELRHLISSEGCAPPPLVGFVRTRQKLSTLHSNKIKHQRDGLWQMMFGEAPVMVITSPFMFSPQGVPHSNNLHREKGQTSKQSGTIRPSSEPPKSGFIPRTQDQGISYRQAIRHTPFPPVVNAQLPQPTSTETCSSSLIMSCVTTPSVCTSHSHAVYDTFGLHNCGSSSFVPNKLSSDAPYSPAYTSSCLNQQAIEAQSEYDEVHRPIQLTTGTDSISNVQFDFLRSEPQLIIS